MEHSTRNAARPRRSHPKSRTGCKTCKVRKIKCDEQRPSCRNCTKHGVKCDFLALAEAASPRSLTDENPSNGLNVLDLELMHNFSTSTYATLSNDTLLRDMWRVSAVQLALNCDYVLRCVLAVSALHLARHRPDKRDYYTSHALLHHQIASRAAMAELSNVTRENVRPLQMFSILTIIFALGSPRRPDGFLLIGESSFPDWMFLLSGTRRFSEILQDDTFTGPLGPMFQHGFRRSLLQRPDDDDNDNNSNNNNNNNGRELSPSPGIEALERLQALVEDSVAAAADDEGPGRAYRHAIRALHPPYRVFLGRGGDGDGDGVAAAVEVETTDVFMWIYRVADSFLPFLRVPTQEAIAIFAHFCVLFKRIRNQWWLEGWADHLISKAYGLLDEEHRLWIRWPIEEMGWLPPPAT
ncbi:hypothetical protein QBC33DRAFT_533237 [Phialemonium atrogriseum]|uniref:Zn(2)-C6 fungal-type domain-containing protein n=1 Tax=Phialemonium atrogriseum TaxID=1093897 RepID=A0AAJ0C3B2_9PEZI|nr:uncharacterized protein QBC33DRAFT_533237 [Phialemonium atrogriseum]KAK1769385.1 hypothetical protein QBC33DRAFT_533237 [Phialemonium atrogriseum]